MDKDSLQLESAYDSILLEGRMDRYMQMFPKLMLDIYDPILLKKNIKWAMDVLKKDDKIVWYLSLLRIRIIYAMIGREMDNDDKYFNKYAKGKFGIENFEDLDYIRRTHNQTELQDTLAHYFTQDLDVFDDVVFNIKEHPNDLLRRLKQLERKYFGDIEGTVKLEDGEDIILKFKDGSIWVNTHTPTCSTKEAKIMQHCGNQYGHMDEGDEIFSFRQPVKGQNKTQLYEPKLTFVVNDGIIRESKGKQNEAPNEKYNPYIFELLKTDYIRGFDQYDSHDSKNNFYIDQLSDQQIEKLREIKDEEFFENSEKSNTYKKAMKMLEEYTFEHFNVNIDDYDFDGGEDFVEANAGATISIPLSYKLNEERLENNEELRKELITDLYESMRLSMDEDPQYDDMFEYFPDENKIEFTIYANSDDAGFEPLTKIENFLYSVQYADNYITKLDEDDFKDKFIDNGIIDSYFFDMYENYQETAEPMEGLPELEFYDPYVYNDEFEPSLEFKGEMIIANFNTPENSDIFDALKRRQISFVENTKTYDILKELNNPIWYICEYFKQLGLIRHLNFLNFRIMNDVLNMSISDFIDFDPSNDTEEQYKQDYMEVVKRDSLLKKEETEFTNFAQNYIRPIMKNPRHLEFGDYKYDNIPEFKYYIKNRKHELSLEKNKGKDETEDDRQLSFKSFFDN